MFHYTTIENSIKIFQSKKLWLVSSCEMNDVTDRFYANLFVTVAILFSNDANAMLLRKNLEAKDILRINMKTLEIPFYSASFCENNNNDYLWKNYADNNKGICIEMDEKYLLNYFDTVVKDNYEPIDENDQFKETSIIAKRKVEYNYPIDTFLKALEFTKQYCVSKKDINNPNEHSKICFQNWLNLTLSIFAGTIKADSFSKED